MRLGAHVTIRGGVENAPERGADIDADVVQIFAKNQRRWEAPDYTDEQVEAWHDEVERTGVAAPVTHASYLINLCQDTDDDLEKARAGFVDELQRAQQLSIPYVVVHPGAHKGGGVDWGLERIAESLEVVVEEADAPDVTPLLEPSAGEGTKIPHSFEQLADVFDHVDEPDRFGVCLDTCHSFAAGYDVASEDGYEDTIDRFDDVVGLEKLKVWHINDSQEGKGSNRDRHANLGEGEIGLTCFERLVNDDRFAETPAILETPIDGYTDYADEIQLLRKLET